LARDLVDLEEFFDEELVRRRRSQCPWPRRAGDGLPYAGISEEESPRLEALEARAALIANAERPNAATKSA